MALSLSLVMPSCALFRGGGGHERCPAYGQEVESNDIENLAVEEIEANQTL